MTQQEPIMQETASPHGAGNQIARVLWGLVQATLFRCSPRFMHRWRNLLLRVFGAQIHPTAHIYPRARIWAPWRLTMHQHACIADDVDVYCVAPIAIGAYSTISQYCYLCTASHDFEDVRHPLISQPIVIGERCWIAADVFIGQGVTVHDGTVVGARSAVFEDLPAWSVAAGTPARVIRPRKLGPVDFDREKSPKVQMSKCPNTDGNQT